MMTHGTWFARAILILLVAMLVGCARPQTAGPSARTTPVASAGPAKEEKHGWWCVEHGIPEAECSMCNAKVAEAFKKKGDWCDQHDRARSQCFLCEPKLKDKYAVLYRAKYGKEPPPIEEEAPKAEEKR